MVLETQVGTGLARSVAMVVSEQAAPKSASSRPLVLIETLRSLFKAVAGDHRCLVDPRRLQPCVR